MLLTGCSVYEYYPMCQPIPQINKKGDFSFYPNIRNSYVNYALTNQIYLSGSFFTKQAEHNDAWNPIGGEHDPATYEKFAVKEGMGGIGYYNRDYIIKFNASAMIGHGYMTYKYEFYDYFGQSSISLCDEKNMTSKILSAAGDFAVFWSAPKKNISIGVSTRFIMNNYPYYNMEHRYFLNGSFDWKTENTYSHPDRCFVEPMFFFSAGIKYLRIMIELGNSYCFDKNFVNYNDRCYSIGIIYSLNFIDLFKRNKNAPALE